VLVASDPGHREVVEDAVTRLKLAKAAFSSLGEVVLDRHPFTVDAVSDGRFGDAIFIVGSDEGGAFPRWKDPEGVLRAVKLAVGTRSGYPPPDLERFGDRVTAFELRSPPVSSSEVRDRVARGEPIGELVPESVEREISRLGLYRGYTTNDPERT